MKTKKSMGAVILLMTFALFMCIPVVSAQTLIVEEDFIEVETLPGTKYYSKHIGDNWFISLGAGMNTYLHSSHKGTLEYNMALDIAGGKWVSPYLALRLNVMGGEVQKKWPTLDNIQSARYVATYADLMWDITNALGGYDPERIVSLRPFAGVGSVFTFQNSMAGHRTYLFPVSGGLNVNFRLCKYADIFLEGRANIMGNNFSGVRQGRQIESIVSLMAGVTINFGRDRFFAYNPYAEQAVRNGLNNEVNSLRERLAEAESRPLPPPEEIIVYVPETIDVKPSCEAKLMSVVRFALNSATITPSEMVNVYNVAQYMHKHHDCTLVITGYADEDTGTSEYNKQLSERRAKAVMDILIGEYKLPASRVEMVAAGSASQPYPTNNNWNRIVLFSTK